MVNMQSVLAASGSQWDPQAVCLQPCRVIHRTAAIHAHAPQAAVLHLGNTINASRMPLASSIPHARYNQHLGKAPGSLRQLYHRRGPLWLGAAAEMRDPRNQSIA